MLGWGWDRSGEKNWGEMDREAKGRMAFSFFFACWVGKRIHARFGNVWGFLCYFVGESGVLGEEAAIFPLYIVEVSISSSHTSQAME